MMFIVCSESLASSALVAAFPTAYVLQMLASAADDLDVATRATLEHGLASGVRHLVVCGHHGCRASPGEGTPQESQGRVVQRCRALHADEHLGPMLRRAGVTMRALWLDEPCHELYACSFEGLEARCMAEADLAAMFRSFDELSA